MIKDEGNHKILLSKPATGKHSEFPITGTFEFEDPKVKVVFYLRYLNLEASDKVIGAEL